jgi:activator of Hsp90 ATPase-like protein
VETLEPERRFAFRWHPYAIEQDVDYSTEPMTLVSFSLEPIGDGTRLTVVESGFDAIPACPRTKAFQMNEKGWTPQVENIRSYLARG